MSPDFLLEDILPLIWIRPSLSLNTNFVFCGVYVCACAYICVFCLFLKQIQLSTDFLLVLGPKQSLDKV